MSRDDLARARADIVIGDPEIFEAIAAGGRFGGDYSIDAAQHMFSRTHRGAIEDLAAKARIVPVGERSWSIRLPIVNASLFETDDGLVVVDTGMAPAGPALVNQIRSVSDAPVTTVVYTHGHVDHAYGTWALIEAGETPEIVAHDGVPERFDSYIRLRGSLAKYMNQPADELPRDRSDLVWPTRTFRDRLELDVGGEPVVLQHHPAETDDQCYVWWPQRRALASADYYQGFLPNLGNGKRRQRGTDDWVLALREMADLGPQLLLPGHGDPLSGNETIVSELRMLADALEHIIEHAVDGLNRGLRKDEIVDTLAWPEPFASHPTLRVHYVTPQDICRMVLKRWTGWWDDVPSHWAPAPLAAQAREVVELAGGVDRVAERARRLVDEDIRLACHLADWAWFADPGDETARQLVLDVYRRRLLDPGSNTQDRLVYLDHMADARRAGGGA